MIGLESGQRNPIHGRLEDIITLLGHARQGRELLPRRLLDGLGDPFQEDGGGIGAIAAAPRTRRLGPERRRHGQERPLLLGEDGIDGRGGRLLCLGHGPGGLLPGEEVLLGEGRFRAAATESRRRILLSFAHQALANSPEAGRGHGDGCRARPAGSGTGSFGRMVVVDASFFARRLGNIVVGTLQRNLDLLQLIVELLIALSEILSPL
mmetsp:Transcript_26532/g.76599  ORF Transcript_26532/g.76599 Transcript_26532/m.76599 type:complete len:208 (-) Transcript_26532:108-731(-)